MHTLVTSEVAFLPKVERRQVPGSIVKLRQPPARHIQNDAFM